ncbi:unnamed protein product [Rotaria sp. Silwood1]|nr:unnamed protein product [Rotaria sp. Silwood1]CAF4906612.1 unnamed protein product [Rotaria sp. Silwood1]CAF5086441.1 unnamed protein product [Rotaria sp. Silwood1]
MQVAINTIRQFVQHPLRDLPQQIFTIQQLVINSFFNRMPITPLMAQPFEVINITNTIKCNEKTCKIKDIYDVITHTN